MKLFDKVFMAVLMTLTGISVYVHFERPERMEYLRSLAYGPDI